LGTGDELTVSKMTIMLEVLSDGEWHGIEELQQLVELNERQVREIAAFLFEYDLAVVDISSQKVRINKCFQEILTQT
jgi:hypothetical protein